MAIRGHQRVISEPSEVISGHISGHQRRPSVAISGHQQTCCRSDARASRVSSSWLICCCCSTASRCNERTRIVSRTCAHCLCRAATFSRSARSVLREASNSALRASTCREIRDHQRPSERPSEAVTPADSCLCTVLPSPLPPPVPPHHRRCSGNSLRAGWQWWAGVPYWVVLWKRAPRRARPQWSGQFRWLAPLRRAWWRAWRRWARQPHREARGPCDGPHNRWTAWRASAVMSSCSSRTRKSQPNLPRGATHAYRDLEILNGIFNLYAIRYLSTLASRHVRAHTGTRESEHACTPYTAQRNGLVYEGRRLSERRLSLSLCVCVSKFVTHVISRPSGLASCSVACSWIS